MVGKGPWGPSTMVKSGQRAGEKGGILARMMTSARRKKLTQNREGATKKD